MTSTDLIGWSGLALSMLGLWFNGKKSIWCWPYWLLSNIMWIDFYCMTHQLQPVILQIVFVGFNILGWIRWSKT